jgi:hypothetical protein
MTSLVDTSVKFFSSTMSGAPVLSGTAGSLTALLDAVLKDGFDTKTGVSITVAGGVATATWSGAHSCDVDTVVLIAGVTGPLVGLNGEQKIASKALNGLTATWATAEANGTAAGTITMKMAPLGWTKVYTGTNKAVYKSSDPASSGLLLRVDDTGTTSARVVGYESMSDVDTGANAFPTTLQVSGGGYWPKSTGANANAVRWMMFGDSRVFYFDPMPGTASVPTSLMGTVRGFGDPIALRAAGDPYACFLSYSNNSTTASQYGGGLELNAGQLVATARSYTGIGSSTLHFAQSYLGAPANSEFSGVTSVFGGFPSDVDGSLLLAKKTLIPGSQQYPRADLPGLYHIPQSFIYDSIKPGDRQAGSRDLTGRNLVFAPGNAASTSFGSVSTSANTAMVAFDVTGPWR